MMGQFSHQPRQTASCLDLRVRKQGAGASCAEFSSHDWEQISVRCGEFRRSSRPSTPTIVLVPAERIFAAPHHFLPDRPAGFTGRIAIRDIPENSSQQTHLRTGIEGVTGGRMRGLASPNAEVSQSRVRCFLSVTLRALANVTLPNIQTANYFFASSTGIFVCIISDPRSRPAFFKLNNGNELW